MLSSRAPSRLLDLLRSSQDPEDGRDLGRSQRELRAAPSGPRGKSGKGRGLPAACPRPPCRRRLPLARSHAAPASGPAPRRESSHSALPAPAASIRLAWSLSGCPRWSPAPSFFPGGSVCNSAAWRQLRNIRAPPLEKLSPNNAIGGQLGVFLSALGFLSFLGLNPPF